jgi:hypothetical protein
MPETRERVYIAVAYGGEELYSECSVNEITDDEMCILLPIMIKNVSAWLKDHIGDKLDRMQNPAYAHQQTSLPTTEGDE